MSKRYEAYKIFNVDSDSPFVVFWWDGERIRCTRKFYLTILKDIPIDGFSVSDGKPFFDRLSRCFKYHKVRKAYVDDEGNDV